MKRIKLWIQEIHLLMLDVDDYTKRCVLAEVVTALIILFLGAYWGRQWLLMAVVVALYVVDDLCMLYHNGTEESALVSGIVLRSKRSLSGKKIHLRMEDGKSKPLFLPHLIAEKRFRKGDFLECRISLKKEPGAGEFYRILTYKVIRNQRYEG